MKVLFFQPKHFNRTAQKTNPFFDPIIRVCEDHGVPYRIYQPYRHPDTGYRKVYNSQWFRRFVCFYCWLAGKFGKTLIESEMERQAGVLWNLLTLGRYKADIYVTVACEGWGVLRGINPNARIVDVQHGIICRAHWGYLERDGSISKFLKQFPEREVWVTGDGYREMFTQHPDNLEWTAKHVRVAGDFQGHTCYCPDEDIQTKHGCILFSLQFTGELSPEENLKVLADTRRAIRELIAGGVSAQDIVLRHHPRYNQFPDIKPLLEEFSGVRLSDDPLNTILRRTSVHVTISSTTALDAAAAGVPTYFPETLCETMLRNDVDWEKEFNYPFAKVSITDMLDMVHNRRQETTDIMHRWFGRFYKPVDEKHIWELLLS